MRLLELCLSPAFGGLEIHFRDFSTWIAEERPDVELSLALGEGTNLDRRLSPLGRTVLRFRRRQSALPLLDALLKARRLARFVKDRSIDLVHVHHKSDLPVAAMAKAMGPRRFVLVHSRHMNLPGRKTDLYHRFIYGQLDRYVVITKYLERQAREHLTIGADRIAQVYYGCARPRELSGDERAAQRRELGLGDGFLVGLAGRIHRYKGQHLLVEAVEMLRGEGLDVSAVIVGGCMDARYLEGLRRRVAERGLGVVFLGFHERIPELMQSFDTVVLTTRNETFGLVLVEAMLAGVPVVGSNAGGVPEIIDDGRTGLLFESFDAGSLADRLRRLYRDPELRRRLARARQEEALRRFDKGRQFGKFLDELFVARGPRPA